MRLDYTFFRVMALTIIGLLAICTVASAAGEQIELKVANYFSTPHHQSKLLAAWAKELEKNTNHKLRLTIFADGSLLKGPETWTGTVQGVADIGCGWIKGFGKEGMNPYHWSPIAMAAAYGAKDAMVQCEIADEIARVFPPYADEMSELKVLANFSMANLVFYSNRYPIRTLSDLKGRTVRTGNKAVSDLVKYLGGNPLFMGMGEVYLALQKGTIDVMAGYPSTLVGYRHAEVAKYVTNTVLPGGAPNLGFVGMNWNTWKNLPPDLQRAIDGSAVSLNHQSRMLRVQEVTEGLNFAKSKGCQIIEFSSNDRKRMGEILKVIAKKAAEEMNAKGLRGTEFMDAAYKSAEKYVSLD